MWFWSLLIVETEFQLSLAMAFLIVGAVFIGACRPRTPEHFFGWLQCFQVVHFLVLFGTLNWGHNLLHWVCQVAAQETSPWSGSRAWLGTGGWALKNSSWDQSFRCISRGARNPFSWVNLIFVAGPLRNYSQTAVRAQSGGQRCMRVCSLHALSALIAQHLSLFCFQPWS